MKIGFACDHAAVDLKNTLLEYLKGKGYECVDCEVSTTHSSEWIIPSWAARWRKRSGWRSG